jgi:hypothetical protein
MKNASNAKSATMTRHLKRVAKRYPFFLTMILVSLSFTLPVQGQEWVGHVFKSLFHMQSWIDANCKPTDLTGIQATLDYDDPSNPGSFYMMLFCRKDNSPNVEYKIVWLPVEDENANIEVTGNIKVLGHTNSILTVFHPEFIYIEKTK